jgi:hypothetical protein
MHPKLVTLAGMTTSTAQTVRIELDEHGKLRPFTAEQCMAAFNQWALNYPSARFMVVTLAPDGSDAEELGWGLALPEYAFAHLPAIAVSGRFRTADALLRMLRHTMDARLIWVDPEPEHVLAEPEE